jgi:hypothetical protein
VKIPGGFSNERARLASEPARPVRARAPPIKAALAWPQPLRVDLGDEELGREAVAP